MIIKTNRRREVEFSVIVNGEDVTENFEDEILEDCEETTEGELRMSERSLEQLVETWKNEVDAFNNGEAMLLADFEDGDAELVVDGESFTCY